MNATDALPNTFNTYTQPEYTAQKQNVIYFIWNTYVFGEFINLIHL
jgi:hypothetical protein